MLCQHSGLIKLSSLQSIVKHSEDTTTAWAKYCNHLTHHVSFPCTKQENQKFRHGVDLYSFSMRTGLTLSHIKKSFLRIEPTTLELGERQVVYRHYDRHFATEAPRSNLLRHTRDNLQTN